MNQDHIEDLLDRYLKKETSAEENQLVEKWLAEQGNPGTEWQALDQSGKNQWLASVFTDIKDSIPVNEPIVVKMKPEKKRAYKIAAAAAILFISLSVYFGWPLLEKGRLFSDLTAVTVPDHQNKQITLPDGSKVWLNEGSKLEYPKAFNGKSRAVYLSGEAYFDIQHDRSKPFLIHTGKLLTTVLGTAFNIKSDAQMLVVTVTRGKVKVEDDGKLLSILTPNQQVSVNLSNSAITEKTVDAKAVINWKDSDLLFDDITFADAALQLQQHFQVRIAFNNEQLKHCRFSGSALNGDNLEKILKVICAFNNATWETRPDGIIMIDGPGCN
ncbi:FecR domain-containing protein [Pedobacter gandavensis]|uniref:FecR family protein n=1 Tax=Pedobacter TaxID=84567 RepID=UPI001C991F4A|nr:MULTISPECIES: FecR domain-containing protein [Pedobacter]WGQ10058.1 FecR domain-containing protein [Pedobacter gandavensis]